MCVVRYAKAPLQCANNDDLMMPFATFTLLYNIITRQQFDDKSIPVLVIILCRQCYSILNKSKKLRLEKERDNLYKAAASEFIDLFKFQTFAGLSIHRIKRNKNESETRVVTSLQLEIQQLMKGNYSSYMQKVTLICKRLQKLKKDGFVSLDFCHLNRMVT